MNRFSSLLYSVFSQPERSLCRTIPTVVNHIFVSKNASFYPQGRSFSVETSPAFPLCKRPEIGKHFLGLRKSKILIFDKKCMSTVLTQHLNLDDGRQVAYKLTVGDQNKPTVVYVPGLLNTMEETKAVAINEFCESTRLTLIRFDYEGIGESPGSIEKVFFRHWIDDLRQIVGKICRTPVIFVAFSMGGWISTKIAIEMPEKLHSMLFVAPGFNFIQYYYEIFYEKLTPEQKKALDDGQCIYFNDLFLRKDFGLESVKHHINLKEKIPITAPIRILHGMLDRDAPYKVSLDLLPKFESADIDLYLRKSGKHYMTEPSDLATMISLLNELVQKYPLNE